MNNRTKTGITFGVGMTVFLILRSLYLKDLSHDVPIIKVVLSSIIAGALSGLVVGWLSGTTLFSRKK
jgi:hypothetical protein